MLLRPTTTALAPSICTPDLSRSSTTPVGVHGWTPPGSPSATSPALMGWKPVVLGIDAPLRCIPLLAADVDSRGRIFADDDGRQLRPRLARRHSSAHLGGDVIENLLGHGLAIQHTRGHATYCRGCSVQPLS